MYTYIRFFLLISGFLLTTVYANGQSDNKVLVNITDIRLAEIYTPEEINEIKTLIPQKYAVLDYHYSKSFIVKNENFSYEHLKRFNVDKFDHFRKQNEKVEITDVISGLTIILSSRLEVDKAFSEYLPSKNNSKIDLKQREEN